MSTHYGDPSQALAKSSVAYEERLSYEQNHLIGKQLLLGAVTVLIYDYIVTFEDEINFVWRVAPRFSMAKLLFIAHRYLPIINFALRFFFFQLMRPSMCTFYPVLACLSLVNYSAVELTLLLRVWVLYSRSRKLGIFLGTLFIAGCGIALYVRTWPPHVVLVHPFQPPPLSLTICPSPVPGEFFFYCIIILTIDVLSFSMIVWKAYISWKHSISTPILTALFMHGSAYYLTVTSVVLVSLVAMMNVNETFVLPFMDSNIATCLSCIAANRLVLSLRGLFYVQDHGDTTTTTMNSKSLYTPRRRPTFEVISSYFEAEDTAVEDENCDPIMYGRPESQ